MVGGQRASEDAGQLGGGEPAEQKRVAWVALPRTPPPEERGGPPPWTTGLGLGALLGRTKHGPQGLQVQRHLFADGGWCQGPTGRASVVVPQTFTPQPELRRSPNLGPAGASSGPCRTVSLFRISSGESASCSEARHRTTRCGMTRGDLPTVDKATPVG
ncbi:hypothetical protein NDU88_003615 [Pleurodeles waltl]|uniref:Uncharacterized protein n=1 Tax=Pleurodeles waltl TaxID=8319 RepID=A0AAV7Q9G9_PLEWA|nr:hypothetical protein NDU88_003615 [Pleurodeles waltl]